MQLKKLILTNFRNYEKQRVDCNPSLNCFLGMNGMGKTNLLDAIYYLCMGKSYFSLPDYQVCRHEADFFRLEGVFGLDGREEKIVAKVQARKKKVFERNDTPYQKLSEHVGLLPVVMIAPDDTAIIREGSETRRRFLDNTLCQLDAQYLNHLIQYNTLLRQRNASLKQMGERGRFDATLLEIYDRQMEQPATHIFARRETFTGIFVPLLRQFYQLISGSQEEADCEYVSPLQNDSWLDLAGACREKDRVLQRTTAGIHKDDLKFTLDGHSLKRFASQGQLKSFVLALKLAQYHLLSREKKVRPLLLLDDIFAKLDQQRVERLLELLKKETFGQLFMTDTDPQRVERLLARLDIEAACFIVRNGKVTEAS